MDHIRYSPYNIYSLGTTPAQMQLGPTGDNADTDSPPTTHPPTKLFFQLNDDSLKEISTRISFVMKEIVGGLYDRVEAIIDPTALVFEMLFGIKQKMVDRYADGDAPTPLTPSSVKTPFVVIGADCQMGKSPVKVFCAFAAHLLHMYRTGVRTLHERGGIELLQETIEILPCLKLADSPIQFNFEVCPLTIIAGPMRKDVKNIEQLIDLHKADFNSGFKLWAGKQMPEFDAHYLTPAKVNQHYRLQDKSIGGVLLFPKNSANVFAETAELIEKLALLRDIVVIYDESDAMPLSLPHGGWSEHNSRMVKCASVMLAVTATPLGGYFDYLLCDFLRFQKTLDIKDNIPDYFGPGATCPWRDEYIPPDVSHGEFPEEYRRFYDDALCEERAGILAVVARCIYTDTSKPGWEKAKPTSQLHLKKIAQHFPAVRFIGVLIHGSGGNKSCCKGGMGFRFFGDRDQVPAMIRAFLARVLSLLPSSQLDTAPLTRNIGGVEGGVEEKIWGTSSFLHIGDEHVQRWLIAEDNELVQNNQCKTAFSSNKRATSDNCKWLFFTAIRKIGYFSQIPIVVTGMQTVLERGTTLGGGYETADGQTVPLFCITKELIFPGKSTSSSTIYQLVARCHGQKFHKTFGEPLRKVPVLTKENTWKIFQNTREVRKCEFLTSPRVFIEILRLVDGDTLDAESSHLQRTWEASHSKRKTPPPRSRVFKIVVAFRHLIRDNDKNIVKTPELLPQEFWDNLNMDSYPCTQDHNSNIELEDLYTMLRDEHNRRTGDEVSVLRTAVSAAKRNLEAKVEAMGLQLCLRLLAFQRNGWTVCGMHRKFGAALEDLQARHLSWNDTSECCCGWTTDCNAPKKGVKCFDHEMGRGAGCVWNFLLSGRRNGSDPTIVSFLSVNKLELQILPHNDSFGNPNGLKKKMQDRVRCNVRMPPKYKRLEPLCNFLKVVLVPVRGGSVQQAYDASSGQLQKQLQSSRYQPVHTTEYFNPEARNDSLECIPRDDTRDVIIFSDNDAGPFTVSILFSNLERVDNVAIQDACDFIRFGKPVGENPRAGADPILLYRKSAQPNFYFALVYFGA